jgi:hypothetical protein
MQCRVGTWQMGSAGMRTPMLRRVFTLPDR